MARKILSSRRLKIYLLAVGIPAVLFLALNYQYFAQQIGYSLHRPAQVVQQTVSEEATDTPDMLTIPALGIRAPVIYAAEKSEKAFQQSLKSGVVHYPGTALPGRFGNAYIFGHSSDYIWSKGSYKTVFALLPKIHVGQEIRISDSEGKVYIYAVTSTFVASPDAVELLDQQGNTKRLLTLQTSYPIGTALKRFIVQAEYK